MPTDCMNKHSQISVVPADPRMSHISQNVPVNIIMPTEPQANVNAFPSNSHPSARQSQMNAHLDQQRASQINDRQSQNINNTEPRLSTHQSQQSTNRNQ